MRFPPGLRRSPFTFVAQAIILGCSTGAGLTAWWMVQTTLLQPLQIPDMSHVFVIESRVGTAASPRLSHVYAMYRVIRDSGACVATAASGGQQLVVKTPSAVTMRRIEFVTSSFFEIAGASMAAGRRLSTADDYLSVTPPVILAHWMSDLPDLQFPPGAVTINQTEVAVVGVLSDKFRAMTLTDMPDMYLPLWAVEPVAADGADYFGTKGDMSPYPWLRITCRIRPDITKIDAERVLSAATAGLPGQPRVALRAVDEAAQSEGARSGLLKLARLIAWSLGILMCVSVVTAGALALLESEARHIEFGTKLALGATRGRVIAELARDVVAVGGATMLVAIPAAVMFWSLIRKFALPGNIVITSLPFISPAALFVPSVVITFIGCAIITVMAAVPVMRIRGVDVVHRLRSFSGAPRQIRMRVVIGAVQIGCALTLISTAALLARSLAAATALNGSLPADVVLGATLTTAPSSSAAQESFFNRMSERFSAIPSIASAAFSAGSRTALRNIELDGRLETLPSPVEFLMVDSRYFGTVGLNVIEGRSFGELDGPGSEPVAVVSASFAQFAGGTGVIGRQVREPWGRPPRRLTIIGIVPDLIVTPRERRPLRIYVPLRQQPPGSFNIARREILIRAAGSVDAARRDASAVVHEMLPSLPPPELSSVSEGIAKQMAPQQFSLTVVACLALVTMMMASAGTYTLAATVLMLRRRELLLRAALGASTFHLRALMVRPIVITIVSGITLGLLGVWWGGRTVEAMLFEVQAHDVVSMTGALAALAALLGGIVLHVASFTARLDLGELSRHE